MTTVGFIGLGIMGLPMATNLVEAGYDVIGYNRSQPKIDKLVAHGGRAASGIAAAAGSAGGAGVIITMLPDSPDVEEVVLGADGVLTHAEPGSTLIDMSTIRPDVATTVARTAAERGVRVLDAPVSGGEQGAIDGTLSIMAGGTSHDFEAAKPVLDVVGGTIVHVGPAGAGQTVKAANQLIVAGTIGLVSEAIELLEAYGVDTGKGVEALAGGLAGNRVLDKKAAAMLERTFQPGFRVELHDKDMGIVTAAAREAGVVIPLGAVAAQLMAALKAQGDGGLDHGALLKLIDQLSGRQK